MKLLRLLTLLCLALLSPSIAQGASSSVDEARSYDSLKQFLLESTRVPVSDRILFHVLLDSYGRGMDLSGGFAPTFVRYVQEILQQRRPFLKADEQQLFDSVLATFPSAIELTQLLNQDDVEAFQKSLKGHLDKLSTGQALFFMGGWSGHATVYEIQKQENGGYRFRVFNTGEGIQYHQRYIVGTQEFIVPYYELVDISEKRLTHVLFLKALQDLRKSGTSPKMSSRDLYGVVLPVLDGKAGEGTVLQESLQRAQRSGTCAYASLMAYLVERMGDSYGGTRLGFEVQTKALLDYFSEHNARFSKDYSARRLMKKAITAYAAINEKAFQEGEIEEGELRMAADLARYFGEALKSAERGANEEFSKAVTRVLAPAPPKVLSKRDLDWQPPSIATREELFGSPRTLEIAASSTVPELFCSASDLAACADGLGVANDEKQTDRVIATIQELTPNLSLDPTDPMWSHVTSGNVETVLASISEIGRQYLRAHILRGFSDSGSNGGVTIPEYLALVKLQAIAECLMRHHQPELGSALPNLRPYALDIWIRPDRIGNAYYPTFDPMWDDQISQLAAFWGSGEVKDSFFGFDRYFAGIQDSRAKHVVEEFYDGSASQKKVGGWDSDLRWHDVQWVAEVWIKRPEVRAAFRNQYPDIAFKNVAHQAMVAMSEEGTYPGRKELLPSAFFVLRDLAFYADYLTGGPLKETRKVKLADFDFSKGVEFRASYKVVPEVCSDPIWQASYHLFGHWSAPATKFKEIPNLRLGQIKDSKDIWEPPFHSHDDKLVVGLLKGDRRWILGPLQEHVANPQQIVSFATKTQKAQEEMLAEAPLDTLRQHQALTSVASLQPVEVLGTYLSSAHLLSRREHQQTFLRLIFNSSLMTFLKKDLRRGAEFAKQALEMTFEPFRSYRDLGDISTALFFAEAARLFQDYFVYYQRVYGHDLQLPRKNLRQELRNLLKTSRWSEQETQEIYLELARTYLNDLAPLNAEGLAELVDAVIQAKKSGLLDARAREDLRAVLYRHRGDAQTLLESSQSEKILNAILPEFAVVWDNASSRFPVFVGKGQKSVLLDVMNGTLVIPGALAKLPERIRHSSCFRELFGEEFDPVAFQVDAETLEFRGPDGREYVLRTANGDTVEWLSDFGDGLYRLQRVNDHDKLSTNSHVWYRAHPTPKLLYIDRQTGALQYVAIDDLKAIQRVDGAVYYDLKDQGEHLGFLANLEEDAHTYLWSDDRRMSVELPRLGLKLYADKGKEWVVDGFPGYHLNNLQHIEQLGGAKHYLVLEKDQGHSDGILVMPRQSLKPLKVDDTPYFPLPEPVRESDQGFPLLIFDISEDGRLTPRSLEARLYLVKLLLWQYKYDLASEYLRGAGPFLQPLSKDEEALLKEICDVPFDNADGDPRAHSVCLLAYYWYTRLHIDFPNNHSWPWREDLYSEYLQDFGWLGHSGLRVEEELFLAKFVLEHESTIPERLRARIGQLEEYLQIRQPIIEGRSDLPAIPSLPEGLPLPDFSIKEIPWQQQDAGALDPSRTLLRPDISDDFATLYRASRLEGGTRLLRKALWRLVGLPSAHGVSGSAKWWDSEVMEQAGALLGTTQADLVDSWQLALRLGMGGKDPGLLQLLRYASQNPERFPSSKELNSEDKSQQAIQAAQAQFSKEKQRQSSKATLKESVECSVHFPVIYEEHPGFLQCASPAQVQGEPVIANFKRYVSERKPSPEELLEADKTTQSLLELFPAQPDNLRLRQAIAAFGDKIDEEGKHYTFQDKEALVELRRDLVKRIYVLGKGLRLQEQAIDQIIARLPADDVKGADEQLRRSAGLQQPLTVDELARLYATQDLELVHQRHPGLSADEIIDLFAKVGTFMLDSITVQQLNRLIDLIDNSEAAELYQAMSAVRAYDLDKHPEYLSFEYFMGILLRPEQCAIMDQLKIQDGKIEAPEHLGAVMEMIMAAGKTSVLLPLLGQLIADGERLALIVLPEALLPSMSKGLQERLGKSFGRDVEVLHVDRSLGDRDISTLQHLLEKLQEARTNRRVLLTTNSSIQSLFLNFVYRLKQYEELIEAEIADAGAYVQLYQGIFRFLKNYATVVVDEIDLVMDVHKAHYYALGEKASLHKDVSNAVLGLYELLLDKELVATGIHLPFMANSGQIPLTADNYSLLLKKGIIRAVLQGRYLPECRPFSLFIDQLQQATWEELQPALTTSWKSVYSPQELLEAYLANDANTDAFTFVELLQNTQIKNILSVLQEELTVVLPLTAPKLLNTHYGPGKYAWAVPYQLGIPIPKSEFGTELELLNYTLQMFLERGIPAELVKQEVSRLKGLVKDQATQGEAIEQFQELVGDKGVTLHSIQDDDCAMIADHIRGNPKLVLRLAQRFVLPRVRVFAEQISANAQIYAFLFQLVHGFSGTLWNVDTFPRAFADPELSDTQERTLHVLWQTTPQQVAIFEEDKSQGESLIDAAGLYRGQDNVKVAKKLLEGAQKDIQGVIYYDQKGELMVMEQQAQEPVPLAMSRLAKDELLAFWDQSHTTGSDLKLATDMKARVTFGRHMILRDLLQSVWRLRQLGKGQSVRFVVSLSDAKFMAETLSQLTGQPVGTELRLGHLLQYAYYNQVRSQGEHARRALKQQMQGVLIREAFERFVEEGCTSSDAVEVYRLARDLFEHHLPQEPYQLYGKARSEQSSEVAFAAELERLLLSPVAGDQSVVELNKILQKMLPLVPQKVLVEELYQREVAVELEAEVDLSQEMTLAQEQQQQQYLKVDDSMKPWPQDAWKQAEPFSLKRYQPIKGENGLQIRSLEECLKVAQSAVQVVPFTKELLTSSNLHKTSWFKKSPDLYAPFGWFQEDVSDVLVIQDKNSGALSMVLLTHYDAQEVERIIIEDRKNPEANRNKEVLLALYDLNTKVALYGSEEIASEVFDTEEFLKLRVQAKFYRGDTAYNKMERIVLEQWLSEGDTEAIYQAFYDTILKWKPGKKQLFYGGVLDHVFQRLGVVTR